MRDPLGNTLLVTNATLENNAKMPRFKVDSQGPTARNRRQRAIDVNYLGGGLRENEAHQIAKPAQIKYPLAQIFSDLKS